MVDVSHFLKKPEGGEGGLLEAVSKFFQACDNVNGVHSKFLDYRSRTSFQVQEIASEFPILGENAVDYVNRFVENNIPFNRQFNVGLFYTESAKATLGPHFDSDTVYTLQLIGTKLWIFDRPNLARLKNLIETNCVRKIVSGSESYSSSSWVRHSGTLEFENPSETYLALGMELVVPAFALHTVRNVSAVTCSLSIGLDEPYSL